MKSIMALKAVGVTSVMATSGEDSGKEPKNMARNTGERRDSSSLWA